MNTKKLWRNTVSLCLAAVVMLTALSPLTIQAGAVSQWEIDALQQKKKYDRIQQGKSETGSERSSGQAGGIY